MQVTDFAKTGDEAFVIVQKSLSAGDSTNAYFLATEAIKVLRGASNKIKETSNGLSLHDKTNEAKFKEGSKTLAEGYDLKRYGLTQIQEGIDKNSMKSMQSAKDAFTASGQDTVSGVAKLAEVLVAYDLMGIMGKTK